MMIEQPADYEIVCKVPKLSAFRNFVQKGLSALDDNSSLLDDCIIVEDLYMVRWNQGNPKSEWNHR